MDMAWFPTYENMPLTPQAVELGVQWKRRYHINPYETVTVLFCHESPEPPLVERYVMMGKWTYPDTPERMCRNAIAAHLYEAMYYGQHWDDRSLEQILRMLTHDARERFIVNGLPWPECMAAQSD